MVMASLGKMSQLLIGENEHRKTKGEDRFLLENGHAQRLSSYNQQAPKPSSTYRYVLNKRKEDGFCQFSFS